MFPKKPFTGDLAKPIRSPTILPPLRGEALGSAIVEGALFNLMEHIRKLDLLADHYGIKRGADRHLLLALALASEFVPGFAIKTPKLVAGRYDDQTLVFIGLMMDLVRKQWPEISDRAACVLIAECEGLRGLRNKAARERRAKALQNRLPAARKAFAEFMARKLPS